MRIEIYLRTRKLLKGERVTLKALARLATDHFDAGATLVPNPRRVAVMLPGKTSGVTARDLAMVGQSVRDGGWNRVFQVELRDRVITVRTGMFADSYTEFAAEGFARALAAMWCARWKHTATGHGGRGCAYDAPAGGTTT